MVFVIMEYFAIRMLVDFNWKQLVGVFYIYSFKISVRYRFFKENVCVCV